MRKMIVYLSYLRFQSCNELVSLVFVELQDASHLYFHQLEDIVLGYLAHKLRVKRS